MNSIVLHLCCGYLERGFAAKLRRKETRGLSTGGYRRPEEAGQEVSKDQDKHDQEGTVRDLGDHKRPSDRAARSPHPFSLSIIQMYDSFVL